MDLSGPEPLGSDHDVSSFSCGKQALDDWLRTRGLANQQRDFTRVIVVHDQGRVVGYYGLAPTAVAASGVPRPVLRTGQPPNPVPCLLLGQLAVDRAWAGRGIGAGLFVDAMIRCVGAARLIGGRAIVIRALDAEAVEFYRARGFLVSRDDPYILYRSMQDVEASLREAGKLP